MIWVKNFYMSESQNVFQNKYFMFNISSFWLTSFFNTIFPGKRKRLNSNVLKTINRFLISAFGCSNVNLSLPIESRLSSVQGLLRPQSSSPLPPQKKNEPKEMLLVHTKIWSQACPTSLANTLLRTSYSEDTLKWLGWLADIAFIHFSAFTGLLNMNHTFMSC